MAKAQYRISTDSNGTSNFGFAYLAIVNPSGSGKRLTLRSLEVALHGATTSFFGVTPATLYKCAAPLDGEDMIDNSVAFDSSVAIPATVKVRRGGAATSYGSIVSRLNAGRSSGSAGKQSMLLLGVKNTFGKRGKRPISGMVNSSGGGYNTEPITLRQNEAVALVVDQLAAGRISQAPVRVNVVLAINGKTVAWDFNANPYPGATLFSAENTGTDPVMLLSWGVMDVGTADTPTLRVVPIGQMYASNIDDTSKRNVGVMKMDSASADFIGKVYTDIGIIPQGVPEVAIADSSPTGNLRSVNYLHTKDLTGPVYRQILVEACHFKPGTAPGIPDTFGLSYMHRGIDLLCRRSGITLNQGEGIAIVNSAETMISVQAAMGGWQPMTFSAQVDVENASQPYLTITGLVPGSDIVVLDAGTTNIMQQIDSYSGTSWSWAYDQDALLFADIAIYLPGYIPRALRNVQLGSVGASIIASQQADRNYA